MSTKPSQRLERLKERVGRLPTGPGVYQFMDESGRVLYVGKASNLRSRVRTYLGRAGDGRFLVTLLMRRAAEVEVITTATAEEALLLENTLIKQNQPPYNLRLKDDKSYLLVRVDKRHPFPRIRLVRKVKKDGATYIGPFASARSVRRSIRYLRTLYPLRTCSDRELAERTRPCLYHQIGRCEAPCIDAVTPEAYAQNLEGTLAILRGRDPGIVKRLRADMQKASDDLDFERAAILRDRAAAIEGAIARQEVVTPDGRSRDVLAVTQAAGFAMLGIVYVRDGHVVATRTMSQRTKLGRKELITAFLSQFYLRGKVVPQELLVEEMPVDAEGLEALLGELRGSKVQIRVPQRGVARDLLAMALENARLALEEHSARAKEMQHALTDLAEALGLNAPPERIEGYDLSHLAGQDPVAGMSVLIGGVPERSAYRHFQVREAEGGDDYGGMAEVIRRRFRAGLKLGALPDLVLIDGGRGQLDAAWTSLEAIGLTPPPMIGLAKARTRDGSRSEERIIRRGEDAPLVLGAGHPALRILVKARDEAHRFAGRYQKTRRAQRFGEGSLDGIPGIGPARKKRLLERFGSVAGLTSAPFEDLAALPGIGERLARQIRDALS